MQITGGNRSCRRDAQVQVDMRVHAEQQMLQHEGPPLIGDAKGVRPCGGRRFPDAVRLDCLQIPVGKDHVQSLHPVTIVENVVGDAFADLERDLAVKRCEVSEL